MTTSDNHDHDKDKDIYHQSITLHNWKEVMLVFWAEVLAQALPYLVVAMFGATVALVIWVGFWVLMLLMPIGMLAWYRFKSMKETGINLTS